MQFVDYLGYKEIHCMDFSLRDVNTNQAINKTARPLKATFYYPDFITYGFKSEEYQYINHEIYLSIIINSGWCSLDDGSNQPRVRVGDMRALNVASIFARPKENGGLHYFFKVNMEVVK